MIPNMSPEVLDAIREHFADEPDIQVDAYLYLANLYADISRVHQLGVEASQELQKMGRCERCGEKLTIFSYKEPHNELEGCPSETMTEAYCPNCDVPGQTKL